MTQTPKKQKREGKEPTTRLSMDVPKSLHNRFKAECALSGRNMTEVVLELLDAKFPPRAHD